MYQLKGTGRERNRHLHSVFQSLSPGPGSVTLPPTGEGRIPLQTRPRLSQGGFVSPRGWVCARAPGKCACARNEAAPSAGPLLKGKRVTRLPGNDALIMTSPPDAERQKRFGVFCVGVFAPPGADAQSEVLMPVGPVVLGTQPRFPHL